MRRGREEEEGKRRGGGGKELSRRCAWTQAGLWSRGMELSGGDVYVSMWILGEG